MSNYTPGPWSTAEGYDRDSGLKLTRVMVGASIVAECYGINNADNARLIAAAPDLLESIQEVIAANASEGKAPGGFSLQRPTKDHQRRVLLAWQKVHAAIAKAEGANG